MGSVCQIKLRKNSIVLTAHRLRNFTVAVGKKVDSCYTFDPTSFVTCVRVQAIRQGETRPLFCNEPVPGRYVAIYMDMPEVLTLCEVEVYGKPLQGITYFQ